MTEYQADYWREHGMRAAVQRARLAMNIYPLAGDEEPRPDWIEIVPVHRVTTLDLALLCSVAFTAGFAAAVVGMVAAGVVP